MNNLKLGPIIISVLVVAGFIALIILLTLKPIAVDERIGDLLKILTGTLAAKFGDVVQYHIGSSSGSKAKDDILKNIAQGTPSA